MAQASAQQNLYTESDYYNLPEDVRAELIDDQLIYNQVAPSRIHQTILSELHTVINNYIKSKDGFCHVYPAPFAVKLNLYADAGVREYWIVDPRTKKVFVYYLEKPDLQIEPYTFHDTIKANIYEDLWINFSDIAKLLNV